MPGALIERPQMTRTMYSALKRHIMNERQKKKQEQEQDEAMERMKKEREMRKKKEEEDNMNLEQTKDQIAQLTKKMETLKNEKHELFSQLKKVLHQEDETKKKAQLKEQSEMMSLAQQYNPGMVPGQHMFMQGHMPSRTKYLSIHQPGMTPGIKRQRTPSPPPASYPAYSSGPAAKYPAVSYKQENFPSTPKQAYAAQNPSSQPNYQPGSVQGGSYPAGQSASSSGNPQPGKYAPNSQSAFTSYPTHFPHQKGMGEHPGYNPGFPVRGVPQQQGGKVPLRHGNIIQEAFIPAIHSGSSLPLQQQLEQANQKSGFSEEKYKLQQQQIAAANQPSSTPKGSIMTGYPVRSQANTATSYTSASQVRPAGMYNMSQAPPRHPYNQAPGRGFY